jgi:hypothetical protein
MDALAIEEPVETTDDDFSLEIEELEERVAPSFAFADAS